MYGGTFNKCTKVDTVTLWRYILVECTTGYIGLGKLYRIHITYIRSPVVMGDSHLLNMLDYVSPITCLIIGDYGECYIVSQIYDLTVEIATTP